MLAVGARLRLRGRRRFTVALACPDPLPQVRSCRKRPLRDEFVQDSVTVKGGTGAGGERQSFSCSLEKV